MSTLPTAHGEKLVMRIFDPTILLKTFAELGLEDHELYRWTQMVSQPNGIVLVTGPTGSGKTTTLYTSLKQLATEEVNVCTIEDPIEMVESHKDALLTLNGFRFDCGRFDTLVVDANLALVNTASTTLAMVRSGI